MNISVKFKALLLVSTMMLVSLGGYALLLLNMATMEQEYNEQTKTAVEQSIRTEAEKINTYMALVQEGAAAIAIAGQNLRHVQQGHEADLGDDVAAMLKASLTRYPEASGCGLWFEPGAFRADQRYYGPYAYWDKGKIEMTMEYSTPEYDYPRQPWYTQAIPEQWDRSKKRQDSVYWSAPYLDETSHKLMITVAGIMHDRQERIVGVSTLDVSLENLRKTVDGIRITPNSRAFAVDCRSGLIAAFPADSALLLQPVAKLPFNGAKNELTTTTPGSLAQYTLMVSGQPTTVFYSVSPTGMGLGIAIPDAELFAEARQLAESNRHTAMGAVGILLVLACVVILVLNRTIISPILSLAAFSRSVAAGNLETPISSAYQSEFSVLRNALVSMLESLKEKMREADNRTAEARVSAENAEQAQHAAEEATRKAESARTEGMRDAAQRLSQVVAALTAALGSLAARVDETSEGVETQTHRIAETASAVEELSASVLEIAKNAETTANLSEDSRHAAEQGSQQFATVLQDVSAIHKDFQTACDSVDDLSNKADAIGAIAQTIEDIADQTNLLALNAAIEAARAGEAGRGFAVVADEVRKLAEKTMTATREVGQSIDSIQQAVRGTLGSMGSTKEVLEKSMQEVNKAESLLGSIVSLAMESSDQVRAIATASEQQSAATGEINASVSAVSSIAEGTATAMQEAANAVEALKRQSSALAELIAELEKA
ncbi:methyl-accepting chemotaxis protein [Desulfovibrio desulfuricans]|uniref:Methyl-accepting chemotaxis protein McpU n=1 Tax=bioreactor metagenome TaxID=1076179 RepID=A0A644T2Y6_9ZZZZ|nr:methyl-accepting chemotaxis protein [Desulfovibrio desulfuricans]MBT9750033.1 HAMP domain-containing protein [Desulfovibrio desulfuricans]MEA4989905.1 methyl-accepting chemotaxis protein [Desulfovibrio desulfuricans]UIB00390.1 methyl-accepting chemotaxis protein [Desulfovibrio desulfuricans]